MIDPRSFFMSAVLALPLVSFLPAQAQDGLVDPTFGADGIAHTFVSTIYTAIPSEVQFDAHGRVVMAGSLLTYSHDLFGVRYLPNGDLDSTFGTNGVSIADFSPAHENLSEMRIAPDGSIYLIGWPYQSTPQRATILRWDTNGAVDPSFGNGGVSTFIHNGRKTYGYSVDVQSDNKVVACGQYIEGTHARIVLFRTTPDGVLDPGFGIAGVVLPFYGGADEAAIRLRVLPDDRILVFGATGSTAQFMRFLPDGQPDPTFGVNGVYNTGLATSLLNAMHLLSDGRAVVVLNDGDSILRLLPDGTPDPTYGVNGIASLDPEHVHNKCSALLPDGRLVIAGDPTAPTNMICVDAAGHLDLGFGTDGFVFPPDTCCTNVVVALGAGAGPRFAMTAVFHSDVPTAQDLDPGVVMFRADSVPQDLPTVITERPAAALSLALHPDPYAGGPLFLRTNVPMANATLEVYDAQGRWCAQARLGDIAAQAAQDVHGLLPAFAPGLYTLRVRAADGRQCTAPLLVAR